jgi:hypothetical protein
MSKALQSLSMTAAVGLALAGSPLPSEARTISARSGSSAFFSQAGCWTPNGPTMSNNACGPVVWHIPLVTDGNTFGWYYPVVTAQGGSVANDVRCLAMSSNSAGNSFFFGGQVLGFAAFGGLPTFGPADNIFLNVWAPSGGSIMIDCLALPGGRVHTVSW